MSPSKNDAILQDSAVMMVGKVCSSKTAISQVASTSQAEEKDKSSKSGKKWSRKRNKRRTGSTSESEDRPQRQQVNQPSRTPSAPTSPRQALPARFSMIPSPRPNTFANGLSTTQRYFSSPFKYPTMPYYLPNFQTFSIRNGVSNEYVSQEILAYYQRNRQSNEKYKAKQLMRQGLENTLRQSYPNHILNLYIVGSTTNGIGDNVSSVDICVMARKKPPIKPSLATESISSTTNPASVCDNPPENQPNLASSSQESEQKSASSPEKVLRAAADSNSEPEVQAQDLTLENIESVLHTKNFAKDIKVIPAKVHIIKFKDTICKLNVTLNMNQDVSIRNSQLIRDYAKMDWRFAPLAMVMKQWARENRINSAVDKGISSYSWTLMVIHFLQVTQPPVLPCLHKIMPRRYETRMGIEQAIIAWRRPPVKWQSNNTSNLRQLLKSMFRYYGYVFSYDQNIISVREGRVLERGFGQTCEENLPNMWSSYLCVEEPFNRTNTTRSVHDKQVFDRIIELFRTSSNALKGQRISLFNVLADDIEFPINY